MCSCCWELANVVFCFQPRHRDWLGKVGETSGAQDRWPWRREGERARLKFDVQKKKNGGGLVLGLTNQRSPPSPSRRVLCCSFSSFCLIFSCFSGMLTVFCLSRFSPRPSAVARTTEGFGGLIWEGNSRYMMLWWRGFFLNMYSTERGMKRLKKLIYVFVERKKAFFG